MKVKSPLKSEKKTELEPKTRTGHSRKYSYSSRTFVAGLLFLGLAVGTYFIFPVKFPGAGNDQSNTDIVFDTARHIQAGIEKLNKQTPLELIYNEQVLSYVKYLLTERKSDLQRYKARSENYFPIIESLLDRHNIPLELKYLAVIESGLDANARSSSDAVGFWQFLYGTCALVDLKVDSYIDERSDIYKSTDAACRYLKYLYQNFRDWELAIAAYNSGPGPIRNAIEGADADNNFWAIQKYLPEQTANYIPALIAMTYIFEFSESYGLISDSAIYRFPELDTTRIYSELSFQQISKGVDMPVALLEELNPQYTKHCIPSSTEGNILVLPEKDVNEFNVRRPFIYSIINTEISYEEWLEERGKTTDKVCITHSVQRGEFFHKIAMKYNCSIENIKNWNKLESTALHPGQELKIWIEK